jgi:hypothetical protein
MEFKLMHPKHGNLRSPNYTLPEQVQPVACGAAGKLSLGFLASYSGKLNFQILLKFDNDKSFKPKLLLTVLSSKMDSFHFHVASSTFETIFLPDVRVWDLWGIWCVVLSRMHLKVAIAYNVYA